MMSKNYPKYMKKKIFQKILGMFSCIIFEK